MHELLPSILSAYMFKNSMQGKLIHLFNVRRGDSLAPPYRVENRLQLRQKRFHSEYSASKILQLFQVADDSIIDESFNDSISYNQLLRHSSTVSIIYCIAYILVFCVGLVGNLFVISVVFRVPRMRTPTNLFIANLAIADVLVIVFCVPATLMSNLFVRKYRINFLNYCWRR